METAPKNQLSLLVLEGDEDLAAVLSFVLRVTDAGGDRLAVLQCIASEVETPAEEITETGENEIWKIARSVNQAGEALDSVWQRATADPARAVLDFLESHPVVAVSIAAEGRRPMDAVDLPLEERLMRIVPCEMVVFDPGTAAGSPLRDVLVPMEDVSSHEMVRDALRSHNCGAIDRIVPLLVGHQFGEDAEPVAFKELEQELQEAGLTGDEYTQVEPAVALAGDSFQGVLSAAHEHRCDIVAIGATTTRILRQLRETERDYAAELGDFRPAILIARPARKAQRGGFDGAVHAILNWVPKLDPAGRLDLFDRLQSGSRWNKNFSAMIGLSTAIASLGLLQNSPAVVIGAMLVAPLMTPLIASGLALVQGNVRLFRSSFHSMVRGILSGLLLSIFIGLVAPQSDLTQEIIARGNPTILDLAVAFLSGVAAAWVIAQPTLMGALAGVAIAAALIPPLASIGISLTHFEWGIAGGASLLLLVNLVMIILGAALVFRGMGVQGSRLGLGPALWVRRAVIWMVLLSVTLAFPLAWQLRKSLRQGDNRPIAHPIAPRLELSLLDRIDQEKGVELLMVGRQSSKVGSEVTLLLTADKPVKAALINELTAMIDDFRGVRGDVDIQVVATQQIVE